MLCLSDKTESLFPSSLPVLKSFRLFCRFRGVNNVSPCAVWWLVFTLLMYVQSLFSLHFLLIGVEWDGYGGDLDEGWHFGLLWNIMLKCSNTINMMFTMINSRKATCRDSDPDHKALIVEADSVKIRSGVSPVLNIAHRCQPSTSCGYRGDIFTLGRKKVPANSVWNPSASSWFRLEDKHTLSAHSCALLPPFFASPSPRCVSC